MPDIKRECALVIAVLACMAVVAVTMAPHLFVLFDEAYNLNLAKTLAQDGLYATHLAEGYRLFDAAVTTGPTVVLPLAAALRLGGASLVVVRAAMIGIFTLSLVTIFLAGWELLGTPLAALAFAVLFFTTPLILEYGLCVLGDIPSIALAVGACGLLHRAERTERHRMAALLAGGLCLSLAILAKDIVALLLPALCVVWLLEGLDHQFRNLDRLFGNLIPVVGAVGVITGWRAFQFAYMRFLTPPDVFHTWSNYGTAVSQTLWHTVIFAPLSHAMSIAGYGLTYHLPPVVTIPVTVVGFVTVRFLLPMRVQPSYAWRVVGVAFTLWLIWFFLLSGPQAIHRHFIPAVVLGQLLAVGFLQVLWRELRHLRLQRRQHVVGATVAGVISLLLLWNIGNGIGFARLYMRSSEERIAAQRTVATWIMANVPRDAALSGWGWFVPWHIAFLADRLPAQAHPETPDLKGLTEWFVLAPELEWSGSMDDRLRDLLARQGPPVAGRVLYPVYRIVWRPAAP